jgi:ABC-type sugar transport system ATPase subunit
MPCTSVSSDISLASVRSNAGAAPALVLNGVVKRYPGVLALDAVDFAVNPGEIHALLGENGAGKSTLIRIMTGSEKADAGVMAIHGNPVSLNTPREAVRRGISLVPQEVLAVPALSIGRNMLFGRESAVLRKDVLSQRELRAVEIALGDVGAAFPATAIAGTLSVPQLRLAQIARCLLQSTDILVFDEPTAVLSEPDAVHLLDRLEFLRSKGKAIIYVSHRLSEVMRIANRITVLRDGRRVAALARDSFHRENIVALMSKSDGTGAKTPRSLISRAPSVTKIIASDLTVQDRLHDVSLTATGGKVIGIAGVQGSGHGYLLRCLAGLEKLDSGKIILHDGQPLGSHARALASGIFFVPADRRKSAIVPMLSVLENIAATPRVRARCRRFGLRWLRSEKAMVAGHVRRLGIKLTGLGQHAGTLSGGNQQKLALARALEGNAQVLLLEEPTQGVDVNAKEEIHALVRQLAVAEGCAIVVASSEFDELIGLADEIHVMRLGRIVASLSGASASYRQILHHALP